MSRRMGFNSKNFILLLIPLIAVAIVAVGVYRALSNVASSSNAASVQGTQIAKAKATAQVSRDFTFPLGTNGSFKYTVIDAQLQKQIIVRGSRATAVDGRIFLIIDLKLTNTQNRGMQVNTRDYIRLSVNDSKEYLAPEIHNDPVEVQAISTQYARVGFPINESDHDYVLHVGAIDAAKQDVKLDFK